MSKKKKKKKKKKSWCTHLPYEYDEYPVNHETALDLFVINI